MTTRHKGYLVTLERDIREDDAEPILAALEMVRGVLSVKPIPASIDDYIASERVRDEIGKKLIEIVYPKPKGD